MWSDIIGKLQQKIDDAAEYLQEDDSESSDESENTGYKETGKFEKTITDTDELASLENRETDEKLAQGSMCEEYNKYKINETTSIDSMKHSSNNCIENTVENKLVNDLDNEPIAQTENLSLTNNLQELLPDIKEEIQEINSAVVRKDSQVNNSDTDVLITKLGKERERSKKLTAERNALKKELSLLKERNISIENLLSQGVNPNLPSPGTFNKESCNINSEKMNTEISKSIDEVEQENKVLSSTLSITTLELEKTRNELHELQISMKEDSSCSAAFTAEREREIQEREEYYKTLLNERQGEYDNEVARLHNELMLAKQQIELLEQRSRELELSSFSSLRENHASVESLQHKVSSIKLELQEERKTNEILRRELITVRHSAEINEKEWSSRVKELTDLVEELSCERDSLLQQKMSLESELDKLRHEWEALGSNMKRNNSDYRNITIDTAKTENEPNTNVTTINNNNEGECPTDHTVKKIHDTQMNVLEGSDTTTAINDDYKNIASGGSTDHSDNVICKQRTAAADKTSNRENVTLMFPSLRDSSITRNVKNEQKTISRLQRQLIKQSIELERLMKVEASANEMKLQYDDLNLRYNTILEMYGQLEEKVSHSVAELEKRRLEEEKF